MELTGKCKEDFENYLEKQGIEYDPKMELYPKCFLVENFSRVPESMQWGVLVDFFDSKDIDINISLYSVPCIDDKEIDYETSVNHECIGAFKSRAEARKLAIEKANEIYNSNTEGKNH